MRKTSITSPSYPHDLWAAGPGARPATTARRRCGRHRVVTLLAGRDSTDSTDTRGLSSQLGPQRWPIGLNACSRAGQRGGGFGNRSRPVPGLLPARTSRLGRLPTFARVPVELVAPVGEETVVDARQPASSWARAPAIAPPMGLSAVTWQHRLRSSRRADVLRTPAGAR